MAEHYPEEQFFLNKTVKEIAENIAPCGFICSMCYNTISRACPGCQNEDEICPIRVCCANHNIRGCWKCPNFPAVNAFFGACAFAHFCNVRGMKAKRRSPVIC